MKETSLQLNKKEHNYHYPHGRGKVSHPVHPGFKVIISFFTPLVIITAVSFLTEHINFSLDIPWPLVFRASIETLSRLFIAYGLSVICAFFLAVSITSNKLFERIFLPIFDVIESIPVLAFLPLIVSFFISMHLENGAAIFILCISMMWSILFTVIGGIKLIPSDIKNMAQVYNISKINYIWHILFPAVIPEIVTGSMLALAAGWNILIVAEAIHLYVPLGYRGGDLTGLGSLLINSSASGNMTMFYVALATMTIIIAIINIMVWQPLLSYAEKFRFE